MDRYSFDVELSHLLPHAGLSRRRRKLIYLAIERAERKWRRAYNWNAAMAAFKIHFGDRIPNNAI